MVVKINSKDICFNLKAFGEPTRHEERKLISTLRDLNKDGKEVTISFLVNECFRKDFVLFFNMLYILTNSYVISYDDFEFLKTKYIKENEDLSYIEHIDKLILEFGINIDKFKEQLRLYDYFKLNIK